MEITPVIMGAWAVIVMGLLYVTYVAIRLYVKRNELGQQTVRSEMDDW